jgi:hypothetical protein
MERKIGEVFELGGLFFKTVEGKGCNGCEFENSDCNKDGLECRYNEREDNISVKFKRVTKPEHINDITDPEFLEPQLSHEV